MSVQLSLFKLADALQIPLTLDRGRVSGVVSGTLNTAVGLAVPFRVEAVQLFANEQCGVICHVLGDLYILASHFPKTSAVSAMIIDGRKLKVSGTKTTLLDVVTSTMSLTEVVRLIGGAIIQSFYYKSGEWKPLTLPK